MVNYRIAEKKDYEEIVRLFSDAFFDYDFHKIYLLNNEQQRYAFYESIFDIVISLGIERKQILIMEENGVILSCAQLQAPNESSYTIKDYLTHGIFKSLKIGGLKNALGYMNLAEVTEKGCDKIKEPHWYFTAFAVLKKYEHQGLGTKMLKECVFPYISKNGGGQFVLCTNSEFNASFYNSNGFETIEYELLTLNGKKLGNWTLSKDIPVTQDK